MEQNYKRFTKLDNVTNEEWFDIWSAELIKAGYIEKIYLQEDIKPFILYKGLVRTETTERILYKGTKREKVKKDVKTIKILSPTVYTPDRIILWTKKAKGLLHTELDKAKECYFVSHCVEGRYISLVEVKAPPGYGGSNSSDASFRVKEKWMFDKYGYIVNKVYNTPNKFVKVTKPYLWLETFTPERYLHTDKLTKLRSIKNWVPRTLEEFLNKG